MSDYLKKDKLEFDVIITPENQAKFELFLKSREISFQLLRDMIEVNTWEDFIRVRRKCFQALDRLGFFDGMLSAEEYIEMKNILFQKGIL